MLCEQIPSKEKKKKSCVKRKAQLLICDINCYMELQFVYLESEVSAGEGDRIEVNSRL